MLRFLNKGSVWVTYLLNVITRIVFFVTVLWLYGDDPIQVACSLYVVK